MKVFIVPGYGTPENIYKDSVYKKYLSLVFKEILDFSLKYSKTRITVIFSGGNTDFNKPFKRTESVEMIKLFKKIGGKRIDNWKIKKEQKSLSSLENLIYSRQIINKIKKISGKITIFCERTRVARMRITANKILKNVVIIPVDLLTKKQLESFSFIKEKEKAVLEYSIWALKSRNNLKKYRKIFIDKFKILRKAPKEKREEVLKQ